MATSEGEKKRSGGEGRGKKEEKGQINKEKKKRKVTHHPINPKTNLLNLRRHLRTHNLPRLGRGDILIVLALLGLSRRSPDRLLQLLTLLQPRRHGDPMHGAGPLVLGPGGARDVAAHDGLEGQDRVLADLHGAVWEFVGDEGEPVGGELVDYLSYRLRKGTVCIYRTCLERGELNRLRERKGKGGKGKGFFSSGNGRDTGRHDLHCRGSHRRRRYEATFLNPCDSRSILVTTWSEDISGLSFLIVDLVAFGRMLYAKRNLSKTEGCKSSCS
ncbi:hypothetical protein KC364_g29 [Hortaea werneckii]|nr:hypothetical protein KC364_g29 [Hortaea werneckii]